MKRSISYLTAVLLVAFAAMAVAAQDYHKYEGFAGYTYANYDNVLDTIDNGVDPTISLRGFNGAFTYNFHRYAGVKFDYSLTAQRETFVDPNLNIDVKYKNNQFFGGIQFKDNAKDGTRWRPFAHVLAGMANQKFNAHGTVTNGTTVNTINTSPSTNNFAMVLGAGLDIKVHKNIDIRAIQFDYNPIFFGDQALGNYTLTSRTQNNIRMSFGIVFH